jgi:hypothetical protein
VQPGAKRARNASRLRASDSKAAAQIGQKQEPLPTSPGWVEVARIVVGDGQRTPSADVGGVDLFVGSVEAHVGDLLTVG